jgi:hypothetical protein
MTNRDIPVTDAMIEAGRKAFFGPQRSILDNSTYEAIYRAMHQASPPVGDDLVERLAEVLAPHLRLSVGPNPDMDDQARNQDECRRVARLAIAALSTPKVKEASVGEGLREAEAEARRFAGFYEQGSDGRNSFLILADKIAALSVKHWLERAA